MASEQNEMEVQLREAGNRLLELPSSRDETLKRLEDLENILTKVAQAPSMDTKRALLPAMKALISDQILKNSDADIKITVAVCFNEIMRITAPDSPYEDSIMKEIFEVIVASFDNLSLLSGASYTKALSIIDNVSKVRSCVMMLDIECDNLIMQMFEQFKRNIRPDHPPSVILAMEEIMSHVIDESDEIPLALLKVLLDCVHNENANKSPMSCKLGARVIRNTSKKLAPYVIDAVKSGIISKDDYAPLIGSTFNPDSQNTEQNCVADTTTQMVPEESSSDALISGDASKSGDAITKPVSSLNATTERQDTVSLQKPARALGPELLSNASKNTSIKAETQKNNDRPSSSDGSKGPSARTLASPPNNEGFKVPSVRPSASPSNDEGFKVPSAKPPPPNNEGFKVPSARPLASSQNNGVKVPLARPLAGAQYNEGLKVPSARPLASPLSNEGFKVPLARPLASPSNNEGFKVPSVRPPASIPNNDGFKVPPTKPQTTPPKASSTELPASPLKAPLTEPLASSLEAPSTKPPASPLKASSTEPLASLQKANSTKLLISPPQDCSKKISSDVEKNDNVAKDDVSRKGKEMLTTPEKKKHHESSVKLTLNGKKLGRPRKDASGGSGKKRLSSSSGTDSSENTMSESGKKVRRKKRDQMDDKVFETPFGKKKYNEDIIDCRVKVWWPTDEQYYEGLITSYNPTTKKHRVEYDDGDIELLHLVTEKFEFTEIDLSEDKTDVKPDPSLEIQAEQDQSTEMTEEPGTSAENNNEEIEK